MIGWLYIMLMIAAASDSLIQGLSLFIGGGCLPGWLMLWLVTRRRNTMDDMDDPNPLGEPGGVMPPELPTGTVDQPQGRQAVSAVRQGSVGQPDQ